MRLSQITEELEIRGCRPLSNSPKARELSRPRTQKRTHGLGSAVGGGKFGLGRPGGGARPGFDEAGRASDERHTLGKRGGAATRDDRAVMIVADEVATARRVADDAGAAE